MVGRTRSARRATRRPARRVGHEGVDHQDDRRLPRQTTPLDPERRPDRAALRQDDQRREEHQPSRDRHVTATVSVHPPAAAKQGPRRGSHPMAGTGTCPLACAVIVPSPPRILAHRARVTHLLAPGACADDRPDTGRPRGGRHPLPVAYQALFVLGSAPVFSGIATQSAFNGCTPDSRMAKRNVPSMATHLAARTRRRSRCARRG